jgi:hypothetical protein
MLTVPLAVAGALIFMTITGGSMNIFSQIGIIMLIGLVAKNGILIVEFANQKQAAGETKGDAILGASLQRLRPILMTSFSTILGLLPLAFASGEGARARIAMGVAVTGGMLISTIMTLYIVPAMYSYVSTDRHAKKGGAKKVLGALAALLLALPASAQTPTYTLPECLAIGLEQNYAVRIARGEEKIAANNATWGNAGFLPSLQLAGGYNVAIDASRTTPRDGTAPLTETGSRTQALTAGVDAVWTLSNGFSVITNWKRLRELEEMGALAARITIEDFVASLTAEYYN